MSSYILTGNPTVNLSSTKGSSWLSPACRMVCSNFEMYASKSPPSILNPFRNSALAFSCSSTSANCLLKACIVLSHSHSSWSWTWKLVTWRRNHALIAFTHSLTNGPCRYVRNSIARWNGILIWLLVILTPSYNCHWVENSSDLLLSPLNTVGGLPISLSLPLCPGSGARWTPGDPAP